MLRRVLERFGHQVVDAPDGRVGLERFGSERVDLVITDLIMPEKEGIETILELRGIDPDIPILAISGESVPEDPGGVLLDASLLGATATLAKPFEIEVLMQTVEALLARGR